MQIDGWGYYNRAAMPTCAPHEEVDTAPIKDKCRDKTKPKKGTGN